MFYKIVLRTLICQFCEKSMKAQSALALKDTFVPRFERKQVILDSAICLENYEVILAKFSSSFFFIIIIIFDGKSSL